MASEIPNLGLRGNDTLSRPLLGLSQETFSPMSRHEPIKKSQGERFSRTPFGLMKVTAWECGSLIKCKGSFLGLHRTHYGKFRGGIKDWERENCI